MFRNRVTVVVLSEDPIPDGMDLGDVARECDEGAYVLHTYSIVPEMLTPEQMAQELKDAGSEPAFFMLEEGE